MLPSVLKELLGELAGTCPATSHLLRGRFFFCCSRALMLASFLRTSSRFNRNASAFPTGFSTGSAGLT